MFPFPGIEGGLQVWLLMCAISDIGGGQPELLVLWAEAKDIAVMLEIAMTSISVTNTIPMFFVFIISPLNSCARRDALRESSRSD